ncbi:MAG: DUF4340 domain-containing protein [Saprospiraceae bacterium]
MNNKKLLYVFLGLIAILGLTQLFNSRKDRSFKSELVNVDTSKVTRLVLHPQSENHAEIILSKENGEWIAEKGQKRAKTEPGSVSSILKELVSIKVKSIATQSKARWQEYEISDSAGSRIEAYAGATKLADFYSGKFGFNPQAKNMTSYLRDAGDNAVYAVEGFHSMTFNPSFSSFRDKTISAFRPDQCTQVSIQSGGTAINLTKSGMHWTANGAQISDTMAVPNFLKSIQHMRGTDFNDDFVAGAAIHSAKIVTDINPIDINIYSSGDSTRPFMVHSSLNPEVYFAEDSSGLYRTLIEGLNKLLEKK